nr:EamA family transporter [Paenarthrobacter nitroguajacolicus]
MGALNIGLFFFLLLFFTAYQLPGGVAALVGSIQPLFVLLLGAPLLGERIRMTHIVACAVGAAGVGLLVLRFTATLTGYRCACRDGRRAEHGGGDCAHQTLAKARRRGAAWVYRPAVSDGWGHATAGHLGG